MSQRSYLSSRHWSAEFLTRRTSGIFNEWDRNFVSSQQVKTFFWKWREIRVSFWNHLPHLQNSQSKFVFPPLCTSPQLTCIRSKWVGEPDYCALTRTRPKPRCLSVWFVLCRKASTVSPSGETSAPIPNQSNIFVDNKAHLQPYSIV